jgi:DNA-binding NtrC family response regulator
MKAQHPRVLLVEDSPSIAAMYQEFLYNSPVIIEHVDTGQGALDTLKNTVPSVILLDLNLPDMSGMDILRHVFDAKLPCAVIIITAHGSIDVAVDAMQFGAFDFIVKPVEASRLQVTVNNAVKINQLSDQVTQYKTVFERDSFEGFLGRSMVMQGVYNIIESAANSKATVFITGESGTGKEVCATAIHRTSPRASGAFVAINCGAIPADLIESELFGHVKGAFTGAVSARAGAVEKANGGTLFLDEIGEMNLDLQVKLLRFLQTETFQKVGSSETCEVDVRIICATNREPLDEVRQGRFREDLYYRLHVIPLAMPPLRDRGDDILLIANKLLASFSKEEGKHFQGFSQDAETAMLAYHWPGNVRELQNVLRNIVVLNDEAIINSAMLPVHIVVNEQPPEKKDHHQREPNRTATPAPETSEVRPAKPLDSSALLQKIRPLWLEEKEIIERAIELCSGNIPKAAALLDVSASTIYRKKQTWDKAEA